jgi:hypothetical protein
VGKRFWWDGTYNFAGFKNATHETGSISQSYPDTRSSATIPGMHGSDP